VWKSGTEIFILGLRSHQLHCRGRQHTVKSYLSYVSSHISSLASDFALHFCARSHISRDGLLCLPVHHEMQKISTERNCLLIRISSPLCIPRYQVKRKPQRCHLAKSPLSRHRRRRNRLLYLSRHTQELHTMV